MYNELVLRNPVFDRHKVEAEAIRAFTRADAIKVGMVATMMMRCSCVVATLRLLRGCCVLAINTLHVTTWLMTEPWLLANCYV